MTHPVGSRTIIDLMASLSDVVPVIREVGVWGFLKRVWKETQDDHAFVYASALSYSWLFAFFPMLVFLLSLIPFLPADSRLAGQDFLFSAIRQNFPPQTAEYIVNNPRLQQLLDTTLNNRRTAILSISFVIALWAASNGIGAIMIALDRCYEIQHGRPFYLSKPLSLLLTLVLTVLVLLVMVLIPIGTFVRDRLVAADYVIPFTEIAVSTWWVWMYDVARHAIGFVAGYLALTLIYNICPSVRMKWRLFSPGALFCFAAWLVIGLSFRMYLNATGGTSYAQTFGPAAGLALLLLVFYLYAAVLLIGAEINSEVDFIRLKAVPGTRDFRPLQEELRKRELAAKRRGAKKTAE